MTGSSGPIVWSCGATLVVALAGCQKMSVIEEDAAAGFNGGFEVERNGLPVNWYVHHPPLASGQTTLSLDTEDPKQGERSLRLDVGEVGDAQGWRAPGFFQVADAEEGKDYAIRFWLKNRGCQVRLFYRSEKPKVSPPGVEELIGPDATGENEWREFEYAYTVPAEHDNLRFEINVLSPGSVWVDDVRIDPVSD